MLLNPFRILGDVSHTVSKCILIWSIHTNKSAEGVSLITQALYCVVFIVRYLDLFSSIHGFLGFWNFSLKIFYISTSLYIVFLMTRVYARTREREKAWKMGLWSLVGAVVCAPVVAAIFMGKKPFSKKALSRSERHQAIFPVSFTFGVIQTLFYFDFAWVYWTRQRVKLRYGDDGTHEAEHTRLADPAAFEDDYEDDAVVVSPAVSEVDRASIKAREESTAQQAGISDGVEWRDDHHS
ncbi:unnamed protein product, partial [Aureobasidium mustum]